ncbi:MAG: hypothetical protein P1P73_08495 [Brevefilum sp.]|nr:hypothetical protein [Brevefilum sp.]MDW7755640.1 hypothetical protein [Brevefilum sp.]
MTKYLCHKKLWVRFLSYLGVSTLIFLMIWTPSYFFLPEGIIRGKSATVIVGDEAARSFFTEFLRIAAYNLFISMVLIIAANWIFKVGCFPLGYMIPLYFVILYAILLGTNSFAIPLPERMAPSFAVLKRSGIYEMIAFILMAASTHRISSYRVLSFIPPKSEEIIPKPKFSQDIDWVGFITAILLLLAANAWEAYQIVYLV